MKAVIRTEYGPPEVLSLADVDKPVPQTGEVLVRVRAASINSWDWDSLRGKPFIARLEGLSTPRHKILGADIAGTVEATGPGVTEFEPGDEVFGDLCEGKWGGFAEYAVARVGELSQKPASMSFETAAATPQAALLALQAVRSRPLQSGDKVLINGAGGGVGTFAIQLAKLAGAEVTGVDSATKLDTMRMAGADQVIDYAAADFTRGGVLYDLIIDVVARRSIFQYARCLTPTGRFVMIGGRTGAILQAALIGPMLSRNDGRRLGLLIYRPNTSELDEIAAIIVSGQLTPVIDRVFPLAETAEAFRYFGTGRVRGKLVITP